MRVAVVGVGGVGGYFGGRLAQAGVDLTFIARGAHLHALREGGLRVESIKGDFTLQPVQASADPTEVGPVDMVLVGVKGWQVADAAAAMAPLLGPETGVVPLLNGVEAPAQLAALLGEQHVLGGLCRISAFIAGPGHIRHSGIEPYVAFGELNNRPSQRAEALRDAFVVAGVSATIPADIRLAMWEKFLLIACWSGVGAVTRVPVGVWRSLPATRSMADQAMREVLAVAQAHGVALSEENVRRSWGFFDSAQPGVMASMQRDIAEGRPSELESQNGALVRLAEAVGVDVPLHRFIYASLLPQERQARSK